MPDYLNMTWFGTGALFCAVAAIICAFWGMYGIAAFAGALAVLLVAAAVWAAKHRV